MNNWRKSHVEQLPDDIVIFSSEDANGENTDEDSDDEDLVQISNLPGSQLRAEAITNLTRSTTSDSREDEDDIPGYVCVPRRDMYWERSFDSTHYLVANAMPRNRFRFIMQNLHCSNNANLDIQDKFSKVRPLIDSMNQRFIALASQEECHSLDGWGYKFWMSTTRLGYVEWFDPYQGSSTTIQDKYKQFGLGASIVLQFVDTLENKTSNISYDIYFDNFFTTLQLLEELQSREHKGTGKIRENRLGKNCKIMVSNTLKKKKGVLLIIVLPRKTMQPNIIKKYNENMGGVDRADENISHHRVFIRGKKWYFPIISQILDMAEQNAWQLYRIGGGKMDHLQFRRSIAVGILESYKKSTKRGPSKPSENLHIHSRFDGMNHLIMYKEKQTRCAMCHNKFEFFPAFVMSPLKSSAVLCYSTSSVAQEEEIV
ncbi:hypothetical protein ILUMI_26270 [Ignelater luminosus]|uniref:PiggyBac transposable element-derived protein domain-containing protein n=1 Tax=Ignelater luminosus TaxID=2038154 RepID=A0A8K0FYU3_IGNLU|nr:hypothetical protein ILUMI_26270 [Ignelater luminosus]